MKVGYVKVRRVNRTRMVYANVASFITVDDTFENAVEIFGKSLFKNPKKSNSILGFMYSQAGW